MLLFLACAAAQNLSDPEFATRTVIKTLYDASAWPYGFNSTAPCDMSSTPEPTEPTTIWSCV